MTYSLKNHLDNYFQLEVHHSYLYDVPAKPYKHIQFLGVASSVDVTKCCCQDSRQLSLIPRYHGSGYSMEAKLVQKLSRESSGKTGLPKDAMISFLKPLGEELGATLIKNRSCTIESHTQINCFYLNLICLIYILKWVLRRKVWASFNKANLAIFTWLCFFSRQASPTNFISTGQRNHFGISLIREGEIILLREFGPGAQGDVLLSFCCR